MLVTVNHRLYLKGGDIHNDDIRIHKLLVFIFSRVKVGSWPHIWGYLESEMSVFGKSTEC